MTAFGELGLMGLFLSAVGIVNHYFPELIKIPGWKASLVYGIVGIAFLFIDGKVK